MPICCRRFGINLEASDLPIEVAKLATSVEVELGYKVDSARLMVESLAAIVRWHKILLEGQTDVILNRWRALSPSSEGAHVELRGQSEWHGGMTVGIDYGGALLVRVKMAALQRQLYQNVWSKNNRF